MDLAKTFDSMDLSCVARVGVPHGGGLGITTYWTSALKDIKHNNGQLRLPFLFLKACICEVAPFGHCAQAVWSVL